MNRLLFLLPFATAAFPYAQPRAKIHPDAGPVCPLLQRMQAPSVKQATD